MSRGFRSFLIRFASRSTSSAANWPGRRRHHVQRLHADHADEGLHGVVGEHAAAAAVAGAGVAGDVVAVLGIRMAGNLVGAHDVERLAGVRVLAGMDRAVRHDDRRQIVLQQRGERADRGLVAGHDRDRAGKAGGAQMLAQRVLRDFAADQRVAHLARAVADAVRRGDRVFGLDQAHLELVGARADARLELGVDRLDLGHDAEIALAVAFGAHDADRRLVNEIRIGPERARHTDGLGGAARMAINGHKGRLHHNHPVELADLTLAHRRRWAGPAVISQACFAIPTNYSRVWQT